MAGITTLDYSLDLARLFRNGRFNVCNLLSYLPSVHKLTLNSAFWIGDLPQPSTGTYRPIQRYNFTSHNITSMSSNETFISMVSSHPAWKALSADIFLGQIIASLIVLTFVAVFLLREWVSQNARPGVFEGVDAPLQMPDPPGPQNPAPQVDGDQGQDAQVQPRIPDQPLPENAPVAGPVFDPEPRRRFADHRALMQRRNMAPRRRHPLEPRRRGGDKGKDVDHRDEEPDADAPAPVRRRLKVKQTSESEDETVAPSYREWNRALRVVQEEARIRRATRQPPLPINSDEAQFTFTAKLPSRMEHSAPPSYVSDSPRQSSFPASAASSWISGMFELIH
jgi:E3 ubiquitin-protein ligase MARCH6